MNNLWRKAGEAAEDARSLFEGRRYDSACNRAYYAMFNAARALLITRGYGDDTAKTHSTVLSLFSKEFVQTGLLPAEVGRSLRRAEKARHDADYDERGTNADEAAAVISALDTFMSAAERHLASSLRQGDNRDQT